MKHLAFSIALGALLLAASNFQLYRLIPTGANAGTSGGQAQRLNVFTGAVSHCDRIGCMALPECRYDAEGEHYLGASRRISCAAIKQR